MNQFVATSLADSCVESLARLFSNATPVRIPVRATAGDCSENVTLEFGTSSEVLFGCSLPVEFGDPIHIANADGTLDVQAVVAAVHYHSSKKAVAARFTTRVDNWIIKP